MGRRAAEKEEQEEAGEEQAGEKEPALGEMKDISRPKNAWSLIKVFFISKKDEKEGDQGGAEAEPEEEAARARQVVPEMHAGQYPTRARSGRAIRSKYDRDGSSLHY